MVSSDPPRAADSPCGWRRSTARRWPLARRASTDVSLEHQLVEITFAVFARPRAVRRPRADDVLALYYLALAGCDRLAFLTRRQGPARRGAHPCRTED